MAMVMRTSVNVVVPYPWDGTEWGSRQRNKVPSSYSKFEELWKQAPNLRNRGDGFFFRGTLISVLIASSLTFNTPPPSLTDTFRDVPSTISGSEKARRIQKPNSAKAESCTRKCVGTCIRGGGGAPGEGPLNIRKPLVVFKEGFRSRQYCLVECSEICNLIGDGDDGP